MCSKPKKEEQVITCAEHPNYQGVRCPKTCVDCWKIYFSTDTDKKKTKYPEEFKKYVSLEVFPEKTIEKKVASLPAVATITEPENISRDANGKITADIPIIINKYFYSEERKATLKLVGFTNNSLIFIEDHKIIVPLKEVEALELIPQSDNYFTYSTRRTPPEAQGKTMRVFPLDKPDMVIRDIQDPAKTWATEDMSWGEDDKLIVESFPKEDIKTKKTKKKISN